MTEIWKYKEISTQFQYFKQIIWLIKILPWINFSYSNLNYILLQDMQYIVLHSMHGIYFLVNMTVINYHLLFLLYEQMQLADKKREEEAIRGKNNLENWQNMKKTFVIVQTFFY